MRASYHLEEQYYGLAAEEESEVERVFLLNRLDSATSGIVLMALSEGVAKSVLTAFEKKKVKKVYSAIVFGAPPRNPSLWKDRLSVKRSSGSVRAQVGGGNSAETRLLEVRQLPVLPTMSHLKLAPLTGRTHQLRIQASKRKCPIAGDRTYGDFKRNKAFAASSGVKRLCLHCVETSLEYSLAGKSYRFSAKSKDPFVGIVKPGGR